jgi:hypothetical protein
LFPQADLALAAEDWALLVDNVQLAEGVSEAPKVVRALFLSLIAIPVASIQKAQSALLSPETLFLKSQSIASSISLSKDLSMRTAQ